MKSFNYKQEGRFDLYYYLLMIKVNLMELLPIRNHKIYFSLLDLIVTQKAFQKSFFFFFLPRAVFGWTVLDGQNNNIKKKD